MITVLQTSSPLFGALLAVAIPLLGVRIVEKKLR